MREAAGVNIKLGANMADVDAGINVGIQRACGVGRTHPLLLSSCSPPSCLPWSLLPSSALLSWICGPSIVVVLSGVAGDTTVNADIPPQGEGQREGELGGDLMRWQ